MFILSKRVLYDLEYLLVKRKLFETETDVLAAESPLVASVLVVRGDGNGD